MKTSKDLMVKKYYPELDGIRAVACLLVMWFHSTTLSEPAHSNKAVFLFGQSGVDLFFVLSGFLITSILIDTQHDKNALKKFYIRRALRIFPLYFAVLVFACIITWNSFSFSHAYPYFLYIQNWSISFDLTFWPYLVHTWTLAIEEQFYLAWPLIFLIIYKRSYGWTITVCTLLILFSAILRGVIAEIGESKLAYTATISHMDGLLMGALLAVLSVKYAKFFKKHSTAFLYTAIITLTVICVFLYAANIDVNEKRYLFLIYGLGLISWAYMALIIGVHFADDHSIFKKILSWTPLTEVGKVSYGLYILHYPLFLIAKSLAEQNLNLQQAQHVNIFIFVIGGACSLIIAYLSYTYFEKPILSKKDKYAPY